MEFRISLRHSCSLFRAVGIGHVGHRRLVLEALFDDLKRRGHREDRLAVLDRHHAPRGERQPVAAAIHLVDDGHPGVARTQEIGVQRVTDAVLHGARGRDQRLAQHLTAEDALPAVLGRDAAEDVLFQPLKIEQRQQLSQRLPRALLPGGAVQQCGRILAHFLSMEGRGEPRKAAESPGASRSSPG